MKSHIKTKNSTAVFAQCAISGSYSTYWQECGEIFIPSLVYLCFFCIENRKNNCLFICRKKTNKCKACDEQSCTVSDPSQYFDIPLPLSFHKFCTFIFISILPLPEGQAGEA